MTDPLSAAASAASFISLGIEVCKGLMSYFRNLRGQDEDICTFSERIENFRFTLETLDPLLPMVEHLESSASPPLQNVRRQILSCCKGMNTLKAALTKFQSIEVASGFREKLNNLKQRGLYPFRKEVLQELQRTVADMQRNLNTALHVLVVYMQGSALALLGTVSASINSRIPNLETQFSSQLPNTIATAIVSRLGDQLKNEFKNEIHSSASQQRNELQELRREFASMQLARTVVEEKERLELVPVPPSRSSRRGCSCVVQTGYQRLPNPISRRRNVDSPWNIVLSSDSTHHHQRCPVYNECKHKRLEFYMSYCGAFLAAAVKASISMTREAGRFSISPTLSFYSVVPSNAEAFELFDDSFRFVKSQDQLQDFLKIRVQKLAHLYSERKALPYDVDQDGNTVLHKACHMMVGNREFQKLWHDSNSIEICFQFLQRLQDLGVPLNKVNTTGGTCLNDLLLGGKRQWLLPSLGETLAVALCQKVMEFGAELPLFNSNQVPIKYALGDPILNRVDANFPDLAEALHCNEISQAILARSESWLQQAIQRAPDLINQPNLFGQTPLHFSVTWPTGMEVLLNKNADLDAVDRHRRTPIAYAAHMRLLEPMRLLGQANCCLFSHGIILHDVIEMSRFDRDSDRDSAQNLEAVNYIISLLSERRRSLENLVRASTASLSLSSIRKLKMSSDRLLDHNADLAIEMLREANVHVPKSLCTNGWNGETVYHDSLLNLKHARSLWQAGFRDVSQPDNFGVSPLMVHRICDDWSLGNFEPFLELVAWFLSHGAKLHTPRGPDLRRRKIVINNMNAGIRAVHYLGRQLGTRFYLHSLGRNEGQSLHSQLLSHSHDSQKLMIQILGDSLGDGCICACSSKGCLALTMMFKSMAGDSRPLRPSHKASERLGTMFQLTYGVAEFLQVGKPERNWIRSEMFRFQLFEILKLRHTCCKMGIAYTVERGDEEERCEIRDEQKEQVDRLESLLVEFEDKFRELGVPFVDFMKGYWHDRMEEVLAEQVPIDKEGLRRIGVVLEESKDGSGDESDNESKDGSKNESKDEPEDEPEDESETSDFFFDLP